MAAETLITGPQIKRIRKELKLTRKALGKLLGVTKGDIRHWETAGPPADVRGLVRLALEYLRVIKRDEGTSKQNHRKRATIRWRDTTKLVTVSAKVPEDAAAYWAVEAKLRGISMTYVIGKALIEAYGVPDGAILEDQ